jgi:hypothetical protein
MVEKVIQMASSELHRIFSALTGAQVRYLVVGGVAVVLHGYVRMTADLDLILDLEPKNVHAALRALSSLGYQPRAPVPISQFADPESRRSWAEEKNMEVFTLWSVSMPMTEVDLFITERLSFEQAYQRGVRVEVGGIALVVVCLEDLIALKKIAGRDKDLMDIKELEGLQQEKDKDNG